MVGFKIGKGRVGNGGEERPRGKGCEQVGDGGKMNGRKRTVGGGGGWEMRGWEFAEGRGSPSLFEGVFLGGKRIDSGFLARRNKELTWIHNA